MYVVFQIINTIKIINEEKIEESLNDYQLGNCAEVDGVNQALNNNANLEDLYIYTIDTTTNNFGTPKPYCENCTYTFKGKVSDIISDK
ncbi:hypothetical protein FDC50_16235 [Clostridium botulinum]|nr:hypothetical protein [Clostridium botulinum]MBY6819213.1 hypothetical protein [Clostridium botulinum]NFJ50628.1 hypothetical protein [Clostridium botulinum]NFP09135.1 hypothetical protein [Clostridium botulinum]NFP13578.1 hypothetical protein [Clostridium botulinum]